jgi:hypothetical protein
MLALKPFHETIIQSIRRCNPSPSSPEIHHLLQLIKETKIPNGHDEIIAAIDNYFDFAGAAKWARDILEVKKSILEQKRVAKKKA